MRNVNLAVPPGWITLADYCRNNNVPYQQATYRLVIKRLGTYKRIGLNVIVPIDLPLALFKKHD